MTLTPTTQPSQSTPGQFRNGRRCLTFLSLLTLFVTQTIPITSLGAPFISYGDFGPVGAGVEFINVSESSPSSDSLPLFGAPSAFATGLDFDPKDFVATQTGSGTDQTKGQLTFSIHTASGVGIAGITTFENGDYTLLGTGTSATAVSFENILNIRVTELDGVPVAPFDLVPVNGLVSFSLSGNQIVQPWSLGLAADITAQIPAGQLATGLEIVIDNNLEATAESSAASVASTLSFGVKKDFRISLTTTGPNNVPEAGATLGLLLAGSSLLMFSRSLTKRHLA